LPAFIELFTLCNALFAAYSERLKGGPICATLKKNSYSQLINWTFANLKLPLD